MVPRRKYARLSGSLSALCRSRRMTVGDNALDLKRKSARLPNSSVAYADLPPMGFDVGLDRIDH
jgi:hypothetical protein